MSITPVSYLTRYSAVAFYSGVMAQSKEKPILDILGDVGEMAIEKAGSGVETIPTAQEIKKFKEEKAKEQQKSESKESESKESGGKEKITGLVEKAKTALDPKKKEPKSFSSNPIVKTLVIAGVVIAAIGLFSLIANIGFGIFLILLGSAAVFIGVFAPIHSSKKQQESA